MKYILLLLTLIIIGCKREQVTYELFNPNPKLKSEDIYNLNLKRIQVVDVDLFEIYNEDTIITFELAYNRHMLFSQRWSFPLSKDMNIHKLELFFKQEYNIETIKHDTIDVDKELVRVHAVSIINNLEYEYWIIEKNKDSIFSERYVVISYLFPDYSLIINGY